VADYLVGDLQGELCPLELLLEFVGFDAQHDILWAAGDLVNRGRQSLEVLRYFYQHQECTRIVLGNHDIHLLLIAADLILPNHGDTFDSILEAPDREELINWLRHQPLARTLGDGDLLSHAGIPPQWDPSSLLLYAGEFETALRSDDYRNLLKDLYGDEPNLWDANLSGTHRLRVICNYLTRMRFCDHRGALAWDATGNPREAPVNTLPWFAHPVHRRGLTRVFFGHWAALRERQPAPNVYALDGGWIWGRQLRLLRLQDMRLFECERRDNSISVMRL
jgi:bis(5'-nucleosyl)-tetraphosphatase (symmetrical)